MIIFILVFSIISTLLTFFATIIFFVSVRKHYKQIFAESFISFISQLDEGKLSDKNHEKYIEYVQSIILKGCDNFSVEQFLLDTHQFHRNKSELYAKAFVKLQHHKTKVFLTALLG